MEHAQEGVGLGRPHRSPVRQTGALAAGGTLAAGGAPARSALVLQAAAGNAAVSRLVRERHGPGLTVQRLKAFEQFNAVMKDVADDLDGSYLGRVVKGIASRPRLDAADAEQNIAFRAAWRGDASDQVGEDADRAMKENLIQSDWYGIGSALKARRLQADADAHLTAGGAPPSPLLAAFKQAMFFRAEREDSHGLASGRLAYDPSKHGPKGSAATMPGLRGEGVRARSERNLFLTRDRKELVDYLRKAVGGQREILNVVASRDDVAAMQYDVDSRGYKTTRPLTGIVTDRMTPTAMENLATWMPGGAAPDAAQADELLRRFLA